MQGVNEMPRIMSRWTANLSDSGTARIGSVQHLQVRGFSCLCLLAAWIIVVFGELSVGVPACTCTPEASAPACQLISRTNVAFLGECVELLPDPKGGGGFGRSIYRFRVERVYKGLDP